MLFSITIVALLVLIHAQNAVGILNCEEWLWLSKCNLQYRTQ